MVGEVRLDRPHGDGTDERARELAQRPARADELDLPGVDLAQQIHDRDRVGEQRALQVLAHDPACGEEGGRRAVDEDRLARLEQSEHGLGEPLLGVDLHLEPLQERVLVAGEAGQDGPAVRPSRDTAALELVEVAPRGHRRDPELGLEGGHRHAAVLPEALRDLAAPLVRQDRAARAGHAGVDTTHPRRRVPAAWRFRREGAGGARSRRRNGRSRRRCA